MGAVRVQAMGTWEMQLRQVVHLPGGKGGLLSGGCRLRTRTGPGKKDGEGRGKKEPRQACEHSPT